LNRRSILIDKYDGAAMKFGFVSKTKKEKHGKKLFCQGYHKDGARPFIKKHFSEMN
jgi:hypothetical protein